MDLEAIKQGLLYGGGGLFILMTLVQISPIKIDPWTWIFRSIGKLLNGEVLEKVDALSKDVQKNKNDDDEQWALLSRSHILRFGDELLHGVAHSKEHFDQILLDITKYELYCESHPQFPNGQAVATIKHIKETYRKCLDENKFL